MAGTAKSRNVFPASAPPRMEPATGAAMEMKPLMPEILPRWDSGSRSASTVVIRFMTRVHPSAAITHPTPSRNTLCAPVSTSDPSRPTTAPIAIHGRRRPNRERVRSLAVPNNGPAITETAEAVPTT